MASTTMPSHATLVDSLPALKTLLDKLATATLITSPLEPPALYFDIEGVQLGRHGSISLISLFFLPDTRVYLLDICTLGDIAFSAKNHREYSLRSILEFPDIPKVFFDVRNDSDALYNLFGISLAGVQDLQLMALVIHPSQFVPSLASCVERDLPATPKLKEVWLRTKEEISCTPDLTNEDTYEIFGQRPVQPRVIKYCCQDVAILPELWKVYASKICKPDESGFWRYMVRKASISRVELSKSKSYNGQARDKVQSPWDNELIDSEEDQWNDDVMTLGMSGDCKLREWAFGIFQWY